VSECPGPLVERLKHYFLTYKDVPGSPRVHCKITHVYGRDEAHEVIRRSHEDYRARFGSIETMLTAALRG
jgi:inorganic pyrophosphatase